MNKLEQKDALERIEKQLNDALKDLEWVKQSIQVKNVPAFVPAGVTLDDLYKAISRYNSSYATRLRHIMVAYDIDTIEGLMELRPRDIRKMRNVGVTTIYYLREALEDLGVQW
jgi:hypothetical protein